MANQIFRKLWMWWEVTFRRLSRLETLGNDREYLFYVGRRRYIGKPFKVDGVQVRMFDPIIELHMNNEFLSKLLKEQPSMMRIGIRLVSESKRSFPALARHVNNSRFQRERVIYGTTFIHRSVEKFGISTFPIQQKWAAKLFTIYLQLVFRAVNPRSAALLRRNPEAFVPRIVAISKARLIQLHGPDAPLGVR